MQTTIFGVGLIFSWIPKPACCASEKPQVQLKGRGGKAWLRGRKDRTTRSQIHINLDHIQIALHLQNYFVHISAGTVYCHWQVYFFFFPIMEATII